MLTTSKKQEENIQLRENKDPVEKTITCIKEKGHDEVEEKEIVYIQNGELITRRNEYSWQKSTPKEQTCEYYTQMVGGMNSKAGVQGSVSCNEYSGNATLTYTISEMDKTDTKLKQFDYIKSDNIFDYESWIAYMEYNKYICS